MDQKVTSLNLKKDRKGAMSFMDDRKKKIIAIALASATVITAIVGAFAYFTDRVDSTATATAGTLELKLSDIEASKTEKVKPGDGITIQYDLSNIGNKSADIRETIVLTSSEALTAGNEEFDLYAAADVSIDAQSGYATVKNNAEPLAVRSVSADRTQIEYELPQFTLNGTGANAETEDGVISNAKDGSYVLVFKKHATNDFIGAELTLDYEAQAKQHRNTGDDTWAIVMSETVSFAGNDAHAAVPAK